MSRVLFPFVGDSLGGSHLSTLALIRNLKGEGFEPVIALNQTGILSEYLDQQNIQWQLLERMPIVKKTSRLLQLIKMIRCGLTLAPYLKNNNVDIVHTNDYRMHHTWLFPAWLTGTKHIWHQRSAISSKSLDFYTSYVTEVVTISEYCRKQFPPKMSKRAVVIANPVSSYLEIENKNKKRRQLLNEIGADNDAFLVAWVGNWHPHKRPLFFIDIAQKLMSNFEQPVIFLMFGNKIEPLYSNGIFKLESLGLTNKVFVLGQRIPIEPWLSACDVLVATAIREGLGRTLIEAMLLEIPVIATDDGGHREVIQDGQTGILVKPDDLLSFCNAINKILSDKEKTKTITKNAKKTALQNYSVRQHVSRITSIYKKALT